MARYVVSLGGNALGNNAEEQKELLKGVAKPIVELIKSGKLELRVYTKQPIHAKIYIMRDYEDSVDFGRVITGSCE